MRVAIYTRVSTEEQAQSDKLSLSDQETRCRQWCTDNGHEVVELFSDPGASAGSLDRPQLQAALVAARRGDFDVLLAKCMDRLTRDIDHGGHLATILSANNIRLQFVDEDFEQSAIGKLMRSISTWRGEEEREKLRRRAAVGRLGRAKAGKHNVTSPPYGYRRDVTITDDGRKVFGPLVVDEYEAEQVRRVYSWFLADGVSIRQIAVRLNSERVPCKQGARSWASESVRRLLINECYAGTGWEHKKRDGQHVDRALWLPVAYAAIIDRETFQRAQERLATNRPFQKPPTGETRHLLQGLLHCLECGHPFQCSNVRRRRRGPLAPIYRCSGQVRRGYPCRLPVRVDGTTIDEVVWQQVVHVCRNPHLWFDASEAASRSADRLLSDAEALIQDIERKIADAGEKRKRLASAVAVGTFKADDPAVTSTLEDIAASVEAWEHDLHRHQNRREEQRATAIDRAQAEALASSVASRVAGMTLTGKQELVRALVKRIWVDKVGNVTIEAALPYLEKAPPPQSRATHPARPRA